MFEADGSEIPNEDDQQYLLKPINRDELPTAVNAMLENGS